MYSRMLVFLGLVLFLAVLNPALGKETNASRLRRGLPPLPPRISPRDKGATASASASARPTQSANPVDTVSWAEHLHPRQLSGQIQVFAGNGSSLGYVTGRDSAPIYGISLNAGSGNLRVRTTSRGDAFALLTTTPTLSGPSYLGALASNDLALHELPKVALSNVDQAPSNSRTAVLNRAFGQSPIWSINSSTQELEARYTNPDGTKSPLLAVFDSHENELYFVGDVDVYNAVYADFPVLAVKLYLSAD